METVDVVMVIIIVATAARKVFGAAWHEYE
jgi:hypothetical protein